MEEPEEVPLKLLLNSSVRWPRWLSSSSSMEFCWETRWGPHTCSQHIGGERKSKDCRRGSQQKVLFQSGLVHLVNRTTK